MKRGAKNNKKSDEDEQPLRSRVREVIEGRYITILMSLTTLYALIGDDFRLWFTHKDADPYFYGGLSASFIFFTIEIFINSCVLNDFKFSFFWWLDIIATLSLIPDIGWVIQGIEILMAMNPSSKSADVIPGVGYKAGGSSKLMKVVKSLRLIRLIRIIKLYKYAVKTNAEAEEAKLKEQQKLSANASQAQLKRELEPSRLGNALSDTTTRRVIIGVLGMLMILPLLTYTKDDYSSEYGIQ